MNICVIGGGGPKGRFGRDFCDRSRQDGHNVYVLSHQPSAENNNRHTWVDFDNVNDVVSEFERLTAGLDHIDIFIYNSKPKHEFPGQSEDFVSSKLIDPQLWHKTIDGHVVLPHLLSISALKKMTSNSKLVFLVSGVGTTFDRASYIYSVGYATSKAAQAFLMMAFAKYNDRGAISTALSPHFDNPDTYKNIFDNTYRYILNMDHNQNGKIEKFWTA